MDMKLKLPALVVNFKTYPEATGSKAIKLAKICESAANQTRKNIWIAVQATDIESISKAVHIPVFAQHIHSYAPGRNTGFITAEAVKKAGAIGTLLNHSEHKIENGKLAEYIKAAKRAGLLTLVFAADLDEIDKVRKLNPDFIAIESPELIAGKVSVSNAKPRLIKDAVVLVKKHSNIPVLCGAGIQNGNDARKASELGSQGVVVASSIVKSNNQKEAVLDIASKL